MKISFVIPAYNAQDFIKQCVNNILNIPYEELEVIVVNDGSTDATADILAGITDNRVKVINQKNMGVSAARNCGIAHASGDFIAFSDADDEILPQEFGKMLSKVDFEKEMYMFAYEKCLGSKINKEPLPLKAGCYGQDEGKYLSLQLFNDKFVSGNKAHYFGGKIYQYLLKKSFLDENNIRFFEDMRFAEDCLFCFCCFNVVKSFEILDFCPYRFIIYSNSASHSYRSEFWKEQTGAYKRACEIAGTEVSDHRNELYVEFGRESIRRYVSHCLKGVTKKEILQKINEVLGDADFVKAVNSVEDDKIARQDKLFINLCRKKRAKTLLTIGRLKNLLK